MANRFKQRIYYQKILAFRDGYWGYHKNEDGTLYTAEHGHTKLYAEDIPEWYLYGRFYKQWGYITTKGITDMVYVSNRFTNHFLKDDCLLVSYGGKIEPIEGTEKKTIIERFRGYDEAIWGSEIIDFLKGARQNSACDITGIIEQIKDKLVWLRQTYPDEFNERMWKYDVDEMFSKPFCNRHPEKYYVLTLDDYSCPSCTSGDKRYYGTLTDIASFMQTLDRERFKDTLEAWEQYKGGKLDASHYVAYNQHVLIQPVRFINDAYIEKVNCEWEFFNAYDCPYEMKCDDATIQVILLRDGEKIIRCIRPHIINLCYKAGMYDTTSWDKLCGAFWGHPGMLSVNEGRDSTIIVSRLYLPEKRYEDLQTGCSELTSPDVSLDPICWEVFGDG